MKNQKIKKSMEIQKSYWAFKIKENRVLFNQILMQLQVFAQKCL